MATTLNPGEVDIKRFELIHTSGNKINLIPYVKQIDIFESIMSPAIFGTMLMVDTIGFSDNLLLGYSDVEIDFLSYTGKGDSNPSSFKLKILSIINGKSNEVDKFKTYTVSLASKEYIKSSSMNVTQNFVDMSHEQMIANLFERLKSDKKITIEGTKNVDFVPISKLNIFKAIDKVRRRSVSKTGKTSPYCFYENRLGYNFLTVEKIIAEGKKHPSVVSGDRNFFSNSANKRNFSDSDWRQVLAVEHVKMENLMDTVGRGGLTNSTWSFNINTGQYEEVKFDALKGSETSTLNSEATHIQKVMADDLANDKDSASVNMLVPVSNDSDYDRITKNSYLRDYVMKMLSNMINIHIHGDSVLVAGSVINLEFPKVDGLTKASKNRLLSGSYVITKLRHIIHPSGKPKYSQSCEIVRTGFLES